MQEFMQEGPRLKNQFTSDLFFRRALEFFLKRPPGQEWTNRLHQVGEDASGKLLQWANQAEQEKPRHIPFDPWGQRRDDVLMSEGWKNLHSYAAEQGLLSTGYERKEGPASRIYQMALLYLFHPSSAFVSCPLAMTDGAARALEIYGDRPEHKEAFQHLTSNRADQFWTSGQWMTEKIGGSDVGQSQTLAEVITPKSAEVATEPPRDFRLYGTKWFTSAITSQVALALARVCGAKEGGQGLSLFLVHLRDGKSGMFRQIQVRRLKDKLGTQALPTAEIDLLGTPATLVGEEGHGVRKIATLFNISRIYNSICSVASMRRALVLASDYGARRNVFGKALAEWPLHQVTMTDLLTAKAGALLFVFRTVELWGKDETKSATTEESALLRLMITLAKITTGKTVVEVASEATEVFGGAGYIEDTGFPRLLRDAHVFPIWEGTTNVLSLDVLRAVWRDTPFEIVQKDVRDRLQRAGAKEWTSERKAIEEQLDNLSLWFNAHSKNEELFSANARGFAFEVTSILTKSLFLEMAATGKSQVDQDLARRCCHSRSWRPLTPENLIAAKTISRSEGEI
ncbi:MAG: acyl-CoA dehydrogenase [Bdellovibrio sp.]|nr:MAG: acyl-CoA dehydrogenase [Bdellovibrio sp.]